jgi:hypothetical protein
MYTATMNYHFRNEVFEEACIIWERHVLIHARKQPGFVRMQFLVASPKAMAIGTWESKAAAEAFMQTGVFKNLMLELNVMCATSPIPAVWELKYYDAS